MDITGIDLEKAALLHDIGKVYQRAEGIRKTHSEIGKDVLAHFFDEDHAAILRAVAYHHQKDLKTAHLSADDISYIIYEADNLASASDRREFLSKEASPKETNAQFLSSIPLSNVFNVFSHEGNSDQTVYRLQSLNEMEPWAYPRSRENTAAPEERYKKITGTLGEIFQQRSPQQMTLPELLQVLEKTMSYVPSSTNTKEAADISLYDHQKLTAAFAICLWHFFQEKGITNYKSYCYGSKQGAFRREPVYLLASGDISGIQKFIYTIPSKGALKSLRGRSLYLDILLEHVVDEILESCQVSRSCLLYTGGGHFYLLLPNTEKARTVLEQVNMAINDWLLRYYGNRLYIALASVPCSAADFSSEGGGTGKVFQRLSQVLSEKKLCRYDEQQLAELFNPDSSYNKDTDSSRECAICHTSSRVDELRPYGDSEDTAEEACPSCNALFLLGKSSLEGNLFAITEEVGTQGVPLPGLEGTYYLQVLSERDLARMPQPRRLYVKNELTLGHYVSTHLWMGDYIARNDQNHAVELTELAQQSGGSYDDTGIARIGVLRADVDNLGAAFIAGFSSHYDTVSRKVTLSRNLSLFFKQYIKTICQGELADGDVSFTLFAEETKKKRKVHVIYSGGDDMFLVGTWDDILETAVDIRHAFQRFTNGKLTFSAGIGFFYPSCPISQMARKTGDLEDYAKANVSHDKDSIALFGEVVERKNRDGQALTARYSWDEFEQKVCRDKLGFLEKTISLNQNSTSKLFVSKATIYRLLDLLRRADNDGYRIDLARFAYTLARLEPKKKEGTPWKCYQALRPTLYDWYQSDEDRQQLITAIELLIYHARDKAEKGWEE